MVWVVVLLVLAIGVGLFVRRLVADYQRTRPLFAEVDKEMAAIESLEIDEAFARAEAVIQNMAKLEEWTAPIPPAIDARLGALDARVAALLRRYRRMSFPDTGTLLSAELLSESETPGGLWIIGVNERQYRNDWVLGIKPGAEPVFEVIAFRSRAGYKSLWHYILLAEDEL